MVAVLIGLALAARAAQTPAAPAGTGKAAPNASSAEPELPKSIFVIPPTPEEGKDPFFPLSTRLRRLPPVVTTATTNLTTTVVHLKLKGFSGPAAHRLAIINNRTFEVGEEGEVVVDSGRVRILCKEIKDDTVRVLVNGQEQTLRMWQGF
jgi:hypothetical protein